MSREQLRGLDRPPVAEVSELFEPLPERAHLQRRLGVSPEVARARLLYEYERLPSERFSTIQRAEGAHLAYSRPSPWLSERLARPVFQLRHLLGHSVEGRVMALEERLDALRAEAPGGLVIMRVPCSSVELNQRLPALGLKWVGVEMTGVIKIDEPPEPPPASLGGQRLRFGELGDEILSQAQDITRSAHSHNHFEYDPLISREVARTLFQDQVALHLRSERAKPFGAMLDGESGVELCGFIVANRVEGFVPFGGPKLANLDLICVNPQRQLRGLGHALNLTALSWLYGEGVRRVSVRTMVNNFAAQSILSRVGWRALLSEAVYHLHL